MIHYIKGQITETMPGKVVIENNGIGYEINVPDNSAAYLQSGETTLYTVMLVREDDISLYGFSDNQSLVMFNLLMTVNGVGAKAAMSILSALNVSEVKRAIIFEDVDSITKANGIGKKTAQRIVLELKEKLGKSEDVIGLGASASPVNNSAKEEAMQALIALGFSKSEAMSSLVGINDNNLTAEQYIRKALASRK